MEHHTAAGNTFMPPVIKDIWGLIKISWSTTVSAEQETGGIQIVNVTMLTLVSHGSRGTSGNVGWGENHKLDQLINLKITFSEKNLIHPGKESSTILESYARTK